MAIYTVHEPPRLSGNITADADRFRFVRDGFYGWAFLLSPLWMLWHRLWLVLLGYLILAGALEAGLVLLPAPPVARVLAGVLLSILVGTEAGTLRRFTLTRRGYRNVGVVVADDLEAAERRFFATWNTRQADALERQVGARGNSWTPPQPASDIIGLFPQPGAPR